MLQQAHRNSARVHGVVIEEIYWILLNLADYLFDAHIIVLEESYEIFPYLMCKRTAKIVL